MTRPNKLDSLSLESPSSQVLEPNWSTFQMLLSWVLPTNVRLDWKVIASYKHSSLLGPIVRYKENGVLWATAPSEGPVLPSPARRPRPPWCERLASRRPTSRPAPRRTWRSRSGPRRRRRRPPRRKLSASCRRASRRTESVNKMLLWGDHDLVLKFINPTDFWAKFCSAFWLLWPVL